MDKKAILIRAHAIIAIGTGHVMRCIAVAEAGRMSGGGNDRYGAIYLGDCLKTFTLEKH